MSSISPLEISLTRLLRHTAIDRDIDVFIDGWMHSDRVKQVLRRHHPVDNGEIEGIVRSSFRGGRRRFEMRLDTERVCWI